MSEQIKEWILREKVIAIVRGAKPEECMKVASALYEGGIRLMEITYDQKKPECWTATAEAIESISKTYEGKMYVGAGTVTCEELVTLTHNHGGKFIISPDFNPNVVTLTKQLGMISMPGCMTPTEIMTAYRGGADFVKLFPAAELGTGYIKAIRSPLSHIPLMAVGGIHDGNIADFLSVGCVGAGVGGNLANRKWIENGEFDRITEAARSLVHAAQNAG